ncbi:DNA-processing protein DprA [Nocardia sp. NPDC050193]
MTDSPSPPTVPDPRRQRAWAVVARAALTDPPAVHTHGVQDAASDIASGAVTGFPAGLGEQAARDLDRAYACGARLLTPDDDQWPRHEVDALDTSGTGSESPIALWVRGTARLDLFGQYRIAVIGARAASDYGIRVAADFAGTFATAGWTVVSGGAFGVDAAAHQAALVRHAPTIAVLATGVDRAHPSAHAGLFDRISEHGLLVSEYPPGSPAATPRFLHRNRLVAALSRAVVIPECGLRSGSHNTARWAHTLGRPVFAVPGPVYSAASAGCHDMIATGAALLATDADRTLDAVVDRPRPNPAPWK